MSENTSANEAREVSNREVKASAFTAYFSDPKNAAQLYSALARVDTTPQDIVIRTLEGVLFLARKNDLAFTVKNKALVIAEHQSSVNENIPLRSVIYYGRTMEKLLEPRALYHQKRIQIPTPEFYMFYNGDQKQPLEKVLKLSDAYIEKQEQPMLECVVKMININLPAGHEILEECRPLYEYSWFVQRLREYQEQRLGRDEAIRKAIGDCSREGIFAEFVREHGTEAMNMLFTQFNMEDALDVRYEEGVEDGYEKGVSAGIAQGKTAGMAEGAAREKAQAERQLIRKVCIKLQRGESPEKIAEDLLEERSYIERICAAAEGCHYEAEAVQKALREGGLRTEEV